MEDFRKKLSYVYELLVIIRERNLSSFDGHEGPTEGQID